MKKNFISFIIIFKNISISIRLFFLIIHKSFQEECEKSTPIKIVGDNKCYLVYCTQSQFDNKECIISNSIIKTQWLTNIINVSPISYRFINFVLTSKNELFLQTTSYPSSQINYFFGLYSNGRPYFKILLSYYSTIKTIYTDSSLRSRYNGELANIIIKKNNKEIEYLMSIGNNENNVELFDLEYYDLFKYSSTIDMTSFNIMSKYFSILNVSDNGQIYYIFSFIGKKDSINYYVLQKYEFSYNSNNNRIEYNKTDLMTIENLDDENLKFILSCFQTDKKLVICFYYNSDKNYSVILYEIYNSNLIEKNTFDLVKPSNNQNLFFKCFHLKLEIGVFYYFIGENENNDKPIIDIIEFRLDDIGFSYERNYLFKSLTTKKDNIKNDLYSNSILKLSDNKFGIIQLDKSQEKIYIIIYNIFNNNKEIISRYYTIDFFGLYNIKVSKEVNSILFNSFIFSAFNFISGDEEDQSKFYTSVIKISYPDCDDIIINLINHFEKYRYSFNLKELINNNIFLDNNIFGLIKKGIKLISLPENKKGEIISLFNSKNNRLIKPGEIIEKNDEINFFFSQSKIASSFYAIEYAGVVTEPDYEKYNTYCEMDTDNGNLIDEKKEFKQIDYIGKIGFIYIYLTYTLKKDCIETNCTFCYTTNKEICVLYNKEEENNEEEKTDLKIEESIDEEELSKIYNKLKEIIDEKSYKGENIVMDMKDILVQLSSIDFQENSINEQNTTNVFLGECKDILKEKYNLKDDEILLILKLDLFKKDSSTPLVEYEVYNYNKSEKLNLEYCNEVKINIYTPIQLDNYTIFLYNNLNSSGYNLFNSNDSFYTDICSLYTTIKGTDISLDDRQKEYFNYSLTLCQEEGCTYNYYDSTINKVKCICPISKLSITDEYNDGDEKNGFISTIIEIYNNKEKIKQIFSSSIKNMNFKVMKCFKLVFKLEYFIKNIGSILLTILIIIYLILMILYFTLGNSILKRIINNAVDKNNIIKKKSIVRFKSINKDKDKEIIKKFSEEPNKIKNIELKKIKTFSGENSININKKLLRLNTFVDKNEIINSSSNKSIQKVNKNKEATIFQRKKRKVLTSKIEAIKLKLNSPPLKQDKKRTILKKSKTLKFNENKNKNIIIIDRNSIDFDREKNGSKNNKFDLYSSNSDIDLNKKNNLNNQRKKKSLFCRVKNDKEIINDRTVKDNKIDSVSKNNLLKMEKLNDEEMNQLDYGTAIIIDKRTYMMYYWSLIKKKNLILFAFYPSNDYNIRIIKMSFFIISFSLYMTINGFFFSDSTMHKVYENNGKFNFIFQIPQIIYSTIISIIINKLLKFLSLSETSILELKKEKKRKALNNKLQHIEKCLKIKLIIYFVLGFSLMLFFWYFISTFCAVYSNTQIILIKNTLISFSLSMIYPFGFSLIPGIFRIPALRAKNQDQECIYKLSSIISLI